MRIVYAFFSLLFILISTVETSAQAPKSGLGFETEAFNGKVPGYGVVWALRVTDVSEGGAVGEPALRKGDIIVSVARFVPTREETGDQEGMRRLIDMARGGDAYVISRVQPDTAGALPEEVRITAAYATGDLSLAGVNSNATLFAQIATADWDRALGRFGGDRDLQAGRRRWLDALNFGYHGNFQKWCDMEEFRPYREQAEQLVLRERDIAGRVLSESPGTITVHQIRTEFWSVWRDSYSRMSGVDLVMRANTYNELGRDITALIRANGCHSEALRQFEKHLAQATERAWRS